MLLVRRGEGLPGAGEAFSGAGDGYSGWGVDLAANAGQAQDMQITRPDGQDVHVHVAVTIGAAPGFSGASLSVTSSTVPVSFVTP